MIQETEIDKYWIAAKKLVGKTLHTQKGGIPFEITEVEKSLKFKRRTGQHSLYSRKKIELYCQHRKNGGEITIASLYAAGIEKNENKGEYTYIPAIVDEILKVVNLS